MTFAERQARQDRRNIATGEPQAPPSSVDDLFLGLDACKRSDADTQVLPDQAMLADARRMAEQAFRLNDVADPIIAGLVRATTARLAAGLAEGTLSLDEQGAASVDTANAEQFDLDAIIRDFGPSESYFRVMDAMNGPVSNAVRVAEAMADSPMLAGFALRLVNGPAYGLPSRVDSLPRAVAMAGFNEISGLAMVVHMARTLGFGDAQHWHRAMTFGVYARRIAKLAGLPGDWFFAAGLLADMGRLAAQRELPQTYGRARGLASRSLLSLHEAEGVVVGESLSEVGARLIESWDGSERLAEVVRLREEPAKADYDPTVCVLHLAEIMAQAACVEGMGSVPVSRLNVRAMEVLGITPDALEAEQIAVRIQARDLAESLMI